MSLCEGILAITLDGAIACDSWYARGPGNTRCDNENLLVDNETSSWGLELFSVFYHPHIVVTIACAAKCRRHNQWVTISFKTQFVGSKLVPPIYAVSLITLIIILSQVDRSGAQVVRWRHHLIVHIKRLYAYAYVDICIRPRSSVCTDTIRFRNKPIRSWPDEFQINVNAYREKEDFINA